jgi:hypothetical protein
MHRTKLAKARECWFYDKPLKKDAFRIASYFNCKCRSQVPGFHRRAKFTMLIDLKNTEDELLYGLGASTRNEVRRAIKDNITVQPSEEPKELLHFYAEFVKTKNRTPATPSELALYWPHLLVTKAVLGGEVLVMHSTLLDREGGRAASLHSASLFRSADDSAKRRAVSRANRFLHYQDMVLCRRQGLAFYDLGGCSPNTSDPELAKITEFKESFGGTLIEESHYLSTPQYLLRQAKRILRRE